jgi:outer membrane protein assembly factor BamA
VRMLHSARYGADGNDPRLLTSYLGSNYLVRGHRQDVRYCSPDVTRPCGDELLGNRLAVGNLEVRVPLWGLRSRQLQYGPLPIDAFFFADGGMVWSGAGKSTRISSIGGGLRVNVGGLPLEVGATRATDGPAPRWQFDFGFRVGF